MYEEEEDFVSNRAYGETSQCPEDMTAEEALAEESRRAARQVAAEMTQGRTARWSHPSGSRIVIQNVVATANLQITIDLKTLALSARNAEYNPRKFAAVIMRLKEPRVTGLIFSTGKMVCTGAKSEHESRMGARKFAAVLDKIGWKPKFTEFTIQNMVATADVGFPIRLEQLVYAHAKFSSYEPELFPGCIYRLVMPKTVILLFVSGRMVITGAKSVSHLQTAFDKIYPVLLQFRKSTQSSHPSRHSLPATVQNSPPPPLLDASLLPLPPQDTQLHRARPTTSVPTNTTPPVPQQSTISNPSQALKPRRRLAGAPRIRAAGRARRPQQPSVLPTIPDSAPPFDDDEEDNDA